jgi:hypothetical protein
LSSSQQPTRTADGVPAHNPARWGVWHSLSAGFFLCSGIKFFVSTQYTLLALLIEIALSPESHPFLIPVVNISPLQAPHHSSTCQRRLGLATFLAFQQARRSDLLPTC